MNGETMNGRLMRYWSTQSSPVREPKSVRFLRTTRMYAGPFLIGIATVWALEIEGGKRPAHV